MIKKIHQTSNIVVILYAAKPATLRGLLREKKQTANQPFNMNSYPLELSFKVTFWGKLSFKVTFWPPSWRDGFPFAPPPALWASAVPRRPLLWGGAVCSPHAPEDGAHLSRFVSLIMTSTWSQVNPMKLSFFFKGQKWLNISNFLGFDLKAAEIHDC